MKRIWTRHGALDVLPPTRSLEEVVAYRREHGCSLIEAMRATGFKPYRTQAVRKKEG